MEPYLALATGLIGGIIQYYTSWLLEVIASLSGVLPPACLVIYSSSQDTYDARILVCVPVQHVKVDDVVYAAPVHMFCGIWGLLAVGLFASPSYVPAGSEYFGVVYGGNPLQLGIQVLGAAVISLWALVLSGKLRM